MANLYNDGAPDFAGAVGTSTLTAFFDTRADAERAVARLKDAGIADGAIRLISGSEADGAAAGDGRSGFWATLEDWLFPDNDRATYAEGLRRGGVLLSVQVNDVSYDGVHEILDAEGSIDMDERADSWRTDGWVVRRSDAGPAYQASQRPAAPNVTAQPGVAEHEDILDDPRDETIPVVKENLRVGKRDVNRGSARVRAYTVEQPLREDVQDDRAGSLSQSQDGGGQTQGNGLRRE